MTEPSRKKQKGRIQPQLSITAPAAPTVDVLCWWTTHEHRPGEINLNDFATGISEEDRGRRRMNSSFTGRPELIYQLAPYIKIACATSPAATVANINPSLRQWWKIFDDCEDTAPVRTLSDLNEVHNAMFLRTAAVGTKHYWVFMAYVALARRELGLPQLFWTSPERSDPVTKQLVNQRSVRLIYHHLKRGAFEAIQRYETNEARLPTRGELHNLFLIFLLRTGWNVQTALDIDITPNATCEPGCIAAHPTSAAHHVISAAKSRAGGRHQYSLGSNKSQLSCGNILRTLAKQSHSMRQRLVSERMRVLDASREAVGRELDEFTSRIATLNSMIRSPWLFISSSPYRSDPQSLSADVGYLTAGVSTSSGTAIMKRVIDSVNRSLGPKDKTIEHIAMSDLRDAYIEAQYQRSGYSWLTAMLAAQHSNIQSLSAYLNKRQYKAHSERRFVSVTEGLWDIAVRFRALDPVHLAGKINGATEVQLSRWRQGKDRTRLGMGCKDFYNPPKEISPSHTDNAGCRVQRCSLCPYAIIFKDSVSHLARRRVELKHLSMEIPLKSWLESTFPEELDKTDKILAEAFPIFVTEQWIKHWAEEIATGRHTILSLEGVYE